MLINRLLAGYNKNITPDDQVSVDITAKLQQIVTIDERQQTMTSSSLMSQSWFDERLSWSLNASNTSLIVVVLPMKSLWIPDTMIWTSADANGYLMVSDYSLASVAFTGQVYMILPALTIKTKCTLYVRKFPFDQQMCSINLTSWSQGTNRIAYAEKSSVVIDTSEYNKHPLSKLDRSPFEYTYNKCHLHSIIHTKKILICHDEWYLHLSGF